MVAANAKQIEAYVDDNGCFICTSHHICRGGYPVLKVEGKVGSMHRVLWQLENRKLATEEYVCHKCDNRLCINLEHMFIGSHLDNMADRDAKGRCASQKGIKNGNCTLTEDQAREIKYGHKELNQREVSYLYGVGRTAVAKIRTGKTWKHI